MDGETFAAVVTRFATDRVIPQFVPEGTARWVSAFGVGAIIRAALTKHGGLIPRMSDGGVDLDALDAAFNAAFSAQPKLAVDIPTIPALAAFGFGGTRLLFSADDAAALMDALRGNTTTSEVKL